MNSVWNQPQIDNWLMIDGLASHDLLKERIN